MNCATARYDGLSLAWMGIFRHSKLSPRKLGYQILLEQGHQNLRFNVREKVYRLYPLFKLKSISLISTLVSKLPLTTLPAPFLFPSISRFVHSGITLAHFQAFSTCLSFPDKASNCHCSRIIHWWTCPLALSGERAPFPSFGTQGIDYLM